MNRSSPGPVAAFSLDAERAFNQIEWGFLMSALSKLGFGLSICHWVKVLYFSPRVGVITNWLVSNFFAFPGELGWAVHSLSPTLHNSFGTTLALTSRSNN